MRERGPCKSGTGSLPPMGTNQLASPPLVLTLFSLFSLSACGGQASPERQSSTGGGTGGSPAHQGSAGGQVPSGAGGAAGAGAVAGTGGVAGAGVAGTAGISLVCPVEQKVGAPTLSKDCQIAARPIDPALTCGGTDCAITKALDLTCADLPDKPWLSATADGAVVMVTTDDSELKVLARLMVVEAAGSRVQDVPALANPTRWDSIYSIRNSAFSSNSSGAKWLFAGQAPGIDALRGTDAGWARATVVSSHDPNYGVVLTDVSMVDDGLGYLTYSTWFDTEQHLATWDGSCWTDQAFASTKAWSTVVGTDAERRPWVAWNSSTSSGDSPLYLRSPSGDTQNLLANVTGDAPLSEAPLRLLPGGLHGTAAFPAVAAKFRDGIRVLSRNSTTDSGWLSLVLPESAYFPGTSDCPSVPISSEHGGHCSGMVTCNMQRTGAVSGFDLARTQSGTVFAAWVRYSSEGTYALQETATGSGEMPSYTCSQTETSGSGTAELVVARLTEADPILTHFRFDLGGAVSSPLSRYVVMAARGDTLVVAAYLNGDIIPTLTYLEIDSNLLP